jgi:hypothetical protein
MIRIFASVLLLTTLPAFAEKVILPLSPPALLALLAPAPENWKLIKSKASNVYSGNLICVADRQFESVPPDTDTGSKKEKMVLTVQLTDTGKASNRIAIFDPKQAGAVINMMEGFPFLKIPAISGEKTLLLVDGRFILSIELPGSEKGIVEKYIKETIKLIKKSSNLEETVVETGKPLTYDEESVDELNPSLNRKFQSSALPAVETNPID